MIVSRRRDLALTDRMVEKLVTIIVQCLVMSGNVGFCVHNVIQIPTLEIKEVSSGVRSMMLYRPI